MLRSFLFVLLTAISPIVFAQDMVFKYVEQMPEPGYDLSEYLSKNLIYPEIARQENKEGRCIVQFVIDIDGSITEVKLIKGFYELCDKEALKVISSMPKWKPGRQGLDPVRVYFTLPIAFALTDPDNKKEEKNDEKALH